MTDPVLEELRRQQAGVATSNTVAASDVTPEQAVQALIRQRQGGAPAITGMRQQDGMGVYGTETYGPIPSNVARFAQDPARAAAVQDDHAPLAKVGTLSRMVHDMLQPAAEGIQRTKEAFDRMQSGTLLERAAATRETFIEGASLPFSAAMGALTNPTASAATEALTDTKQKEDAANLLQIFPSIGEGPVSGFKKLRRVYDAWKSGATVADVMPQTGGKEFIQGQLNAAGGLALGTIGLRGGLHEPFRPAEPPPTSGAKPSSGKPEGGAPTGSSTSTKPVGPVDEFGRYPVNKNWVLDNEGKLMTFGGRKEVTDWIFSGHETDQVMTPGRVGDRWGVFVQSHAQAADPMVRPGADPVVDAERKADAEFHTDMLAVLQDNIAGSKTQGRDPVLMKEYLDQQGLGDTKIGVWPEAIAAVWQTGEQPFKHLTGEIEAAATLGRDVEMPLSTYLAETAGKSYADVLNKAVTHGDASMSLDEAKELPKVTEPVEGEEPQDIGSLQKHEIRADVNTADELLQGDAARAIDSFIGVPPGTVDNPEGMAFGLMSARRLEDALANPESTIPAELETVFKPIRDKLRKQYGNKIKLYRAQDEVKPPEPGVINMSVGSDGKRRVLSWTSDKKFAEEHAGARKDRTLFTEEDIREAEATFAKDGEVKIGKSTIKHVEGSKYPDIYVGQEHITDTDSVRAFMEDINKDRQEVNTANEKARAKVITKDVPLNDVIWISDRAGQSEFIVRNETDQLIEDYDYSEELKDLTPEEKTVVAEAAPSIKKAVAQAARNTYLKPLFAEAKTAGMTEPEMALWGKKLQAAVSAANDKLFTQMVAQLKKERTPSFKEQLLQNTALVEQEFFNRPDIQAYHYLRYGQHPNGAPLDGPVKLDYDTAVEQYGKERIDALPKELFSKKKDLRPAKEEIRGKAGANLGRLAKMLGSSIYGDAKDIMAVSIKEILQNSFDATVRAIVNDKNLDGKIDIKTDSYKRTVTFSDNGTGMAPEILGGKFLEIAGSDKGENSAGGFGIAKMLFLYENEQIRVATMKDGVLSTMQTSGAELKAALEGGEQPVIKVRRGKDIEAKEHTLFPEGHGTWIEVTIPRTYTKPDGESADIPFMYGVSRTPALRNSPLFRPIEVTVNKEVIPIGKNFPANEFTQFAVIEDPRYTARVYISQAPREDNYGENVHVLSNGLWQFSKALKAKPGDMWGENLPYNMYIDVRAKVKPEDGGYPFQLNRQGFSTQVNDTFNKILAHIQSVYGHKMLQDEVASFGSVQYVNRNSHGEVVGLSKPQEIKPEVPVTDLGFQRGLRKGDIVSVTEDGRLLVNGKELPPLDVEKLKSALPSAGDLRVPQESIDSVRTMYHSNVEVKVPFRSNDPLEQVPFGDEATVPFTEYMLDRYPTEFIDFIDDMGYLFDRFRREVGRMEGYTELEQYAVGISVDETYRGVSILVPFKGKFINPFLPEADTPVEQAYGTMITMIHELAHFKERSHGVSFIQELQRLLAKLEANRQFDFPAYRKQFEETYVRYADMVNHVKGLFDDRRATNSGKSFDDGVYEPISDGGDEGNANRVTPASTNGRGKTAGTNGGNVKATPNAGKLFESTTPGLSADEVAQMFGYGSGDAMLNDLQKLDTAIKAGGLKSPKDYVKQLVQAQALNKTRLDEGYDVSPEGLAEAAQEAFVNTKVEDLLVAELKQLAKDAGLPFDKPALQAFAARAFAQMTVGPALKVSRHVQAISRTARKTEQALLKGKIREAFEWKQKQYINQLMLKEAFAFIGENRRYTRKLKTWGKYPAMRSVQQDYLNWIHVAMRRMDLPVRRPDDELQRAVGDEGLFQEWVQSKLDAGDDIYLASVPELQPPAQTVGQYRDVMAMLESLATNGKAAQEYWTGHDAEEREALLDEMEAQGPGVPMKPESNTVGGRKTPKQIPGLAQRGFDAPQRTVQSISESLDDGNPNGVFNRVLINPARTAAHTKSELMRKYTAVVKKAWDSIPLERRKAYNTKIEGHPLLNPRTGQPLDLILGDIPAVLANMGNAENFVTLAEGYGTDPDTIHRWINDVAVKEEWDFAQAMGDMFEELFPLIEKNKRERSGYGLAKVQTQEIESPFGTYAGWYWPKLYDSELRAEEPNWKDREVDLMEKPYRVASAPTGFEQRRQGGKGPLFLNVRAVLNRHLDDVFTQIAYGQFVRSAYNFLHETRVANYVRGKMGMEYYKQLEPWLRDQIYNVDPTLQQQAAWQRGLRFLRYNASNTYLGLSYSVGISQAAGLANTAARIGLPATLNGMRAMIATAYRGRVEEMIGKSEILRDRMDGVNRDMLEQMETHRSLVQGPGTTYLQAYRAATELGHKYLAFVDFWFVSGPTWLGAYNKFISENVGMDAGTLEQHAARYADAALEATQGTGEAKDLQRFERTQNEMLKVATMFYTYPGRNYNQLIDAVRDLNRGKTGRGYRKLFWLLVAAPIVQNLATFNGPEEDGNWFLWALAKIGLNPFESMYLIREPANVIDRRLSGGGGADFKSDTFFSRAFNAADRMWHASESNAVKNSAVVAGLLGILPTGGSTIGNVGQVIWDYSQGNDPEHPVKKTLTGRDQ